MIGRARYTGIMSPRYKFAGRELAMYHTSPTGVCTVSACALAPVELASIASRTWHMGTHEFSQARVRGDCLNVHDG